MFILFRIFDPVNITSENTQTSGNECFSCDIVVQIRLYNCDYFVYNIKSVVTYLKYTTDYSTYTPVPVQRTRSAMGGMGRVR